MLDQKKCGTCRYYDKTDGYCCQKAEYHHGYDGDDCGSWDGSKRAWRFGEGEEDHDSKVHMPEVPILWKYANESA